jgi:prolyl-tRNA synthetase
MRGREFVMKDLYSFHATQADLDEYYAQVSDAYERIFAKLGIGELTFKTFASGGSFTDFSHEFQTICEAGEDWLFVNREKNIAVNEEVLDDFLAENPDFAKSDFEKVRSAEVGNIFNFGDKKARDMGLNFAGEDGKLTPVFLASYGIGITRLVGVVAEIFADEKGLVWPENVAPFQVYLANISDDAEVLDFSRKIYDDFAKKGVEVLWDDRDARPGEKFADAELMGIPHRIVVSRKTLAENKMEYKARKSADAEMLGADEILAKIVK